MRARDLALGERRADAGKAVAKHTGVAECELHRTARYAAGSGMLCDHRPVDRVAVVAVADEIALIDRDALDKKLGRLGLEYGDLPLLLDPRVENVFAFFEL